jgi:hypothetical protein
MPPGKSKRRQALAPGLRAGDAALDIDLAEVDLRVDEMRAALESAADAARGAAARRQRAPRPRAAPRAATLPPPSSPASQPPCGAPWTPRCCACRQRSRR